MEEIAEEAIGSGLEADSSLYSDGQWTDESATVPAEMLLTVFVNGKELVSLLCTPTRLNALVMGFLYSEGLITGVKDVAAMRVCEDDSLADVLLNVPYLTPEKRTLTSGCGSGVSFNRKSSPVQSDLSVSPAEVLALMAQLYRRQELFRNCGGVHCSALCDTKEVLVAAEDIGRHNTLDKVLGECLLRGMPTKDRILLTTGRVSSEMLLKAAKMQVPVVVSRGSPTGRAVQLGRELGVAVVGYARSNRLTVFSNAKRLKPVATGAGNR